MENNNAKRNQGANGGLFVVQDKVEDNVVFNMGDVTNDSSMETEHLSAKIENEIDDQIALKSYVEKKTTTEPRKTRKNSSSKTTETRR